MPSNSAAEDGELKEGPQELDGVADLFGESDLLVANPPSEEEKKDFEDSYCDQGHLMEVLFIKPEKYSGGV
jgi:hypothetical protein